MGVIVSISLSTHQLDSLPGGQILNRGILKGYLGPATLKADSSGVRTLLPRTQFYQTAGATPQLHALSELARSWAREGKAGGKEGREAGGRGGWERREVTGSRNEGWGKRGSRGRQRGCGL